MTISEDDIQWAKDKRRARMGFLLEDRAVFGLVPVEEAELARLLAEFGQDSPS